MTFDRATVAAFDVDGTLTTRDCVTPFLLRTARFRTALALLGHPLTVLAAITHRDRDRLKEVVCAAFAGMTVDDLDAEGAVFAREIERRWLRDDTTARLRRHRELGHRVVLASASLEPYLRPLGARLGVDGIVCTRLACDAERRLTGRLDGLNCRGAEKARRLGIWLAENDLAGATLWAYGDSAGDTELLELAEYPVWVRRMLVEGDPG